MILFILIALALAAAMLAALGLPILKGTGDVAAEDPAAALNLRLAAIDRDREAGLIGDEAAEEAKIEAKRAALERPEEKPPAPARRLRFAAIAYLALTPVIVGGVYMVVGAPKLIVPPKAPPQAKPDPNAIAAMNPEDRRAMIGQMVAGLSARLEENPNDPADWRMLARSQMVLGRPVESAESYRRLFDVDPGTLEDWRNFAGALINADPNVRFPTDDEFTHALDEIEKRAPGDLMVLFYRGGAARKSGDYAAALADWKKVLAAMPANAPVRPALESLIAETEKAAKGGE